MATEQRFARITDAEIEEGYMAIVKAYPEGAIDLLGSLPRLIRAGLRGLPYLKPAQVRAVWEAAELRSGWPARAVQGEVLRPDTPDEDGPWGINEVPGG
jgi:hypothetical protein